MYHFTLLSNKIDIEFISITLNDQCCNVTIAGTFGALMLLSKFSKIHCIKHIQRTKSEKLKKKQTFDSSMNGNNGIVWILVKNNIFTFSFSYLNRISSIKHIQSTDDRRHQTLNNIKMKITKKQPKYDDHRIKLDENAFRPFFYVVNFRFVWFFIILLFVTFGCDFDLVT